MATIRRGGFGRIILLVLFGIFFVGALTLFSQSDPPKAKAAASEKPSPAAVKRGQVIFKANCDVCHNADSLDRKIGPGLKGVSKRETFANGDKGGIPGIENRIATGTDTGMPAFKDKLSATQVKDLIAYLKTL